LSTQSSQKPAASRRERRAAARKAAPVTRESSGARARRSPLLWITLVIGGVGVIALAAVVLLQGGAATADTTNLVQPKDIAPAALADGRTLGKPDAPVTLEVWSDFQCPVCGQFATLVEPQLITTYVAPGTLRIVHHDAAFQGAKASSSYDESVEAAAGARCAAAQNLYWPFQDWLFANQSGENKGAFADARLRALATAAGLDVTAWDACRATGQEQAAVKAETKQAQAAGINATPTMTINGQTIVGLKSVTELGQMIEAAAASAAPG
jgi:protein-disulfide isomerase